MKKQHSFVPIAVIGISCWYPDARNPGQLWENILARRRQFRFFPDQRLPISEYYDPDPDTPDKTYNKKAAMIDGFDFDWASRRVTRSTYESTDIAHWLAMEVAIEAISDAGFDRHNIPKERTGVIVGNSLTGEQTRANAMRLRWPFVRRALRAAAQSAKLAPKQLADTEDRLEFFYKSVFPAVNEDTLAGGLSNTIAGRICHYFNLLGGGYTVDGACSSSLLAIATGATGLANGDLDLVLAGGVDISLDSFELVGFSKTKALAPKDMMVYDRRGNGFIPGEGCGFVILKRLEDARRDNNYIYAVVHGWGISSDGKSTGITAPSATGQAKALERAYERAPYHLDSLKFIEGHGTGTIVGDRIELEAIALAMGKTASQLEDSLRCCAITSLKSIIGHCKAASGIGGFIKAVMAVNRRIIPPTASCRDPNPVFDTTALRLYPAILGRILNPEETVRAGVSSMGFGGINCHLTLESADVPSPKLCPTIAENKLMVSNQDTELFLITANSAKTMITKIEKILWLSHGISIAELTDLAWKLSHEAENKAPVRCAIIAGDPEDLAKKLEEAILEIRKNFPVKNQFFHDPSQKVWIGNHVKQSRVGILFPGQGSQQLNMGRVPVSRFTWARDMFQLADAAAKKYGTGSFSEIIFRSFDQACDRHLINQWQKKLSLSEFAQPAISMVSAIWFQFLKYMGLNPNVMGGHSLGELSAFYAAGAMSIQELFRLSALRGKAMAAEEQNAGTMVSFRCSKKEAEKILKTIDEYVVIANINAPLQVVLSGEIAAVKKAVETAAKEGIQAVQIPVSNAFHSKMASGAAKVIKNETFLKRKIGRPSTRLFSSYTCQEVDPNIFLNDYFSQQVLAPVNFMAMVQGMIKHCDFFLEVGPGRVLTGLINSITGKAGPVCYPVESTAFHDEDLNRAIATIFIHGIDLQWETLFRGRLVRPFTPASDKIFIENPCERSFESVETSVIANEKSHMDILETHLSGLLDFSESEILSYLKARGPFLAKVIEADLKHPASESFFPVSKIIDIQSATQTDNADAFLPEKSSESTESIESMVLSQVEKFTGFSIESLSLDMRLLDDLNLDSIKAGDLVAQISKSLLVETSIEPLDFANATLDDIINKFSDAVNTSSIDEAGPDVSDVFKVLMEIASELTGYPIETLDADALVTEELNIGLEMLQKIMERTAQILNVDLHVDFEPLKKRSFRQIASILHRMEKEQFHGDPTESSLKALGIELHHLEPWVRDFKTETVEAPFPPLPVWWGKRHEDNWQHVNALILRDLESNDIAQSLQQGILNQGAQVHSVTFEEAETNKLCNEPAFSMLIAILPGTSDPWQSPESYLHRIVKKISSIASPPLASKAPRRRTTIVYIQFGGGSFGNQPPFYHLDQYGVSSLAKSIHLERDDVRVRVFDFSRSIPAEKMAEIIIRETNTPAPFAAVGFDHELKRLEQRHRVMEPVNYHKRKIQWGSEDVILITGGARGITASIGFGIARATGASVALVGSSPDPDNHPGTTASIEITETLHKFSNHGLTAEYFSCDVRKERSVLQTIDAIHHKLGKITGVIHGAGLNKPRPVQTVTVEDAMEEVGVKVLGVLNLMNGLKKTPPKMFAGISSIVGSTGMPGNAWYGFSNEMLDMLIRKFGADHSQTTTFSVAYSIWRDEGMGYRMKSVAYLKRIGIDAIPTDEGIRRFVRLFTHDPGTDRIIVTARLNRVNTFHYHPLEEPDKVRYLEKKVHVTPEVESIFQAHLAMETDPYIADHLYNGFYLLPTVFGLEAMAQAAAHLMGKKTLKRVRIENIRLKRPITVDPLTGADILIQAQALEKTGKNDPKKIFTGIFKPDADIHEPYFSAEFTLDLEDQPKTKTFPKPQKPLGILPKFDLYRDNLLFQGPMFQRIHQILSIVPKENGNKEEAEEAVFTTKVLDPETVSKTAFKKPLHQHLILGDPFFRDSLLQAGQILIPTVACLPVFIEKLDIYPFSGNTEDTLTGIVQLHWRKETEIQNSVIALDSKGIVRESIDGYKLHILRKREKNPFSKDLVNPEQRDNLQLKQMVQYLSEQFEIVAPSFEIAYLPDLHQMTKEKRHECELPLIRKVISQAINFSDGEVKGLSIQWQNNGKPNIAKPENLAVDISLSHDERILFCAAGTGRQGCDVAPVTHRSRQKWLALIGKSNELTLDNLLDTHDTIDIAATRIWGVKEVIQKATGNIVQEITILKKEKNAVLFKADLAERTCLVLTHAITLTWGPNRVFSMLVNKALRDKGVQENFTSAYQDLIAIKSYDTLEHGGPQGQGVFIHRFPLNFKPNSQLSRRVYFSNYFFWLGEVREMSAWPVLHKISEQFSTGKWGLVTNRTHMRIVGEATAQDQIEIRFWVSSHSSITHPVMELNFDFRKVLHGGEYERLAWCEQQVTWVKILDHGKVEADPYPDYYWNFVRTMLPRYDAPNLPESLPETLAAFTNLKEDTDQYKAPAKPTIEPLLYEKRIETSLENSNIVGNIYFANYYAWQGLVRDHYFYSIIPEFFRGVGEKGELLCLQSHVQHLREAMPFDTIIITMSLKLLKRFSVIFHFEYFRQEHDGSRTKLAFGEQHNIWVIRDKTGKPDPSPFPGKVFEVLKKAAYAPKLRGQRL